jgi:hypothetical protein
MCSNELTFNVSFADLMSPQLMKRGIESISLIQRSCMNHGGLNPLHMDGLVEVPAGWICPK